MPQTSAAKIIILDIRIAVMMISSKMQEFHELVNVTLGLEKQITSI